MDTFETAKQFFIQGLHLLEANNLQAAEKLFAKSLELLPDRASTLNNLAFIKNKLLKYTESEALARKAVALEDSSPEGWSNLGFVLSKTDRPEEALKAFDQALKRNPAHAGAAVNKAMTLLGLKRYDEALMACDEALTLNSNQAELLYMRSLTLKDLQRPDDAKADYLRSMQLQAATMPAFISERRATQQVNVLVINRNPDFNISLFSFKELQLKDNYPGQLATRLQDDFHLTYIFEGDAIRPEVRKVIPPPDVVINNNVNAELILGEGKLPDLSALFDGFGVPVINHPSKAVKSTRDESIKLLENLPGVVVPKTMRFSSTGKTVEEVAREIEGHYQYPIIVRSLTLQQGVGMTKVDSQEGLFAVLAGSAEENFFVTQFVPSGNKNKFYRKIRATAVGGEVIITRIDYSDHWNVRGRKQAHRVAFYLANKHLLEEEKKICANPEAELGLPAIQALNAIRDRIPLDVFGIDLDVDAAGKVIFYEANATMNLFSAAQPEVPYASEPEDRMKQTFKRHFLSLANRR